MSQNKVQLNQGICHRTTLSLQIICNYEIHSLSGRDYVIQRMIYRLKSISKFNPLILAYMALSDLTDHSKFNNCSIYDNAVSL